MPAVLLLELFLFLTQPVFEVRSRETAGVPPERLRAHVEMLSKTFHPRDWTNVTNLNRSADYIAAHLAKAGGRVERQPFTAVQRPYQNVLASWGPVGGPRIVVGAHYDSVAGTPGADDNASGVAGLIELAYLLQGSELSCEVQLAAYSLEEPPFFAGDHMGSVIHVNGLQREGVELKAALILEMIGCFDAELPQKFPLPLLRLFYPDHGDFLAIVGRHDQSAVLRCVKRGMLTSAADLPIHAICTPAAVPGMDFSDHRNFWSEDLPAVMITDTAFFRNAAYHQPEDTADSLNYERMAQVVSAVYGAVLALDD